MDDNEKSLIIDRKYTCPICDAKITAKSVKSNGARFVETKEDLRPIYSNINPTKYDTVCCNHCGFSALTKDFTTTTSVQRKLIHEKIQSKFVPQQKPETDTYTTAMAITRLKMALLCSISKEAKKSEIGNICLKISWLYEDLIDEIPDDDLDANEKREIYMHEYEKAAKNAYDSLVYARMHEDFPIAGMNETTLDYLLAYFSYKYGEYQQAMQYLSGVITNKSTSPRLKEKSVDLKELISSKLHSEQKPA
jgi:uncharacterized protein (DUF2225 family)